MKKTIVLIPLLFILFSGCKKTTEAAIEDIVIKAMTSGPWVVTDFTQNGNNITTDFSAYKFQYYSNKTVDAIKNNTVETTGTWDGNAASRTTQADFSGAVSPLSLVNGTWHIDNNSWTFVVASQQTGSVIKTMRLDKL